MEVRKFELRFTSLIGTITPWYFAEYCVPVSEVDWPDDVSCFRIILFPSWRWTMPSRVACRCSMLTQLQCWRSSVTQHQSLSPRLLATVINDIAKACHNIERTLQATTAHLWWCVQFVRLQYDTYILLSSVLCSFKFSIITVWSYLIFAIIGSVFFFAIFIMFLVFLCVLCSLDL